MNKDKYINLANILRNITPHSEKVKEFLKINGYYNKKSDEKSKTLKNIIELESSDVKNQPQRNLIDNNDEKKIKQLEDFLENTKDIDITPEDILKKLEEIEKEISDIQKEQEINKKIVELKNKDREDSKTIEEEFISKKTIKKKLKEVEEQDKKIKLENESQNLIKEELEIKNNKIKKELFDDEKRKEKEEKEKNKILKQVREEQENENLEKIVKKIEEKNKEKIQKNEKDRKKFLDNEKYDLKDRTFVDRVRNKNNIKDPKAILKQYSLDNKESAIQEVRNLDNQAKALQVVIDSIKASGNTIPQELLSHLHEILNNKHAIESAVTELSGISFEK